MILSELNVRKHIEGRTTYNFDTSSFDILILSARKLFIMQPGLFPVSVFLSKPALSLKSSTSVTDFLPKNNKVHKVHVKLGVAHQGCFCTLFEDITRAFTTTKMDLFVMFLNGFQPLTNVTKNSILDVVRDLGRSLFLYINILFQNIDN